MKNFSNCHIEAWRAYRQGNAIAFCFYPTKYAKAERLIAHPAMLPVRAVGTVLQWICWPLTHIGEYLRTGRWYHLHWIDHGGVHWEFIPDGDNAKSPFWIPPLLFHGKAQQVYKPFGWGKGFPACLKRQTE